MIDYKDDMSRHEFHITEVTARLYLSGRIRSERDLDCIAAKGIGAVVSLVEDQDYALPDSVRAMHCPVADGTFMPADLMDGIFSFIMTNIESTKVLICCSAGVSRSAGIVLGYLMMERNWPWGKAFRFLNRKRSVWPALEVKESVKHYCAARTKRRFEDVASVDKEEETYLQQLNHEIGFVLPRTDAIGWPARGYAAKGRHVTGLGLYKLGLKAIPHTVFRFRYLTDLYLYENEIAQVPVDIKNLVLLRRLGLSRNSITELPEETGTLKNLEFLSVSWNLLKAIPECAGLLVRLKELYLNNNKIDSVPDSLCGLCSLRELYLQHNELMELPSGIGSLVHLTHLGLDANSITLLPDSTSAIRSLRALNLRSNRLRCLPEGLECLRRLDNINLSSNDLCSLSSSITGLRRLRRLNIGLNEGLTLTEEESEWIQGLKERGCIVVTDRN